LGGCGFQPQDFTGWKPVPLYTLSRN